LVSKGSRPTPGTSRLGEIAAYEAAIGEEEGGAVFRIHLDNVPDSKSFIVAETVDGIAQAVVRGYDFDDEEWRVEDHSIVLAERALHDQNVRHAVARLSNTSPALRADSDLELLFEPAQMYDQDLL
jgi:hypothetical protein